LVFVNKELYAKCPRSDKSKISKGIVAAIRHSGGRFLEHNERQDVYFDIGDKKVYQCFLILFDEQNLSSQKSFEFPILRPPRKPARHCVRVRRAYERIYT
jgi:hypothetical protein